jgi:hypothetical protein
MYLGASEPYDLININGNPPLEVVVKGGIPGDSGTIASTINTLLKVINSGLTGLITIKELPVSLCHSVNSD